MSTGIEAKLTGNLTRDADARTSKAGKEYVILNVAVGEGDKRQFVSVFVFGDSAAKVGKLVKGSRVKVEGKVEISTWTGNDGQARYGLKVMSFKADVGPAETLESAAASTFKMRNRKPAAVAEPSAAKTDWEDDIPF